MKIILSISILINAISLILIGSLAWELKMRREK